MTGRNPPPSGRRGRQQRFLDDHHHGTPDLWEGQRKTLKVLAFPHWDHPQLTRLLKRLVEDGHDVAGHTVTTAQALLPDETFTLPDGVGDLSLAAATTNNGE